MTGDSKTTAAWCSACSINPANGCRHPLGTSCCPHRTTNIKDAGSPQTTAFQIGDDIFVRDPERFVSGCTCIVGPVISLRREGDRTFYTIQASVGKVGGGAPDVWLQFEARDIGHRLGTPISKVVGISMSNDADRPQTTDDRSSVEPTVPPLRDSLLSTASRPWVTTSDKRLMEMPAETAFDRLQRINADIIRQMDTNNAATTRWGRRIAVAMVVAFLGLEFVWLGGLSWTMHR